MTTVAFNPRFENYARAHGRAPSEQLAHDKTEWPGGLMTGFILWHRDRLGEARRAIPAAFTCGGLTDHETYDAWLTRRVDQLLEDQ